MIKITDVANVNEAIFYTGITKSCLDSIELYLMNRNLTIGFSYTVRHRDLSDSDCYYNFYGDNAWYPYQSFAKDMNKYISELYMLK